MNGTFSGSLAHSFVHTLARSLRISQSLGLVHYFSDVFLHTYGFLSLLSLSLAPSLFLLLAEHSHSTHSLHKIYKSYVVFSFPFFFSLLLLLCCCSLAAFSTISISWFSNGNRNRFPFFTRITLSMSNIFRFYFSVGLSVHIDALIIRTDGAKMGIANQQFWRGRTKKSE